MMGIWSWKRAGEELAGNPDWPGIWLRRAPRGWEASSDKIEMLARWQDDELNDMHEVMPAAVPSEVVNRQDGRSFFMTLCLRRIAMLQARNVG
jgi:hypothetical protein